MSLQNNHLFINVALLALFSLNTMAFPLFETKNTLMNAHAGSSGVIELQKDFSGFYVEADLSYYPFGSSNSTDSFKNYDSVKMMVSLSNDETMVATDCLNFSSYDCNKYHCYKEDWSSNLSFPSFNASVQAAEGYIYLDYFFWGLTSTNLYIAQSCQTGNYSEGVGIDRYGVLGLGTGNGSDSNYITSELFSVYVKPNLASGKLLFMNDASTYAKKSSEPIYTLQAKSSWQTSVSNASLQLANSTINLSADKLIFDVNSDAIGLPFENYKSLSLAFFISLNVYCNFDLYKTSCYFIDKIVDLPDITLSINNDTNLTIPSGLYSTPFVKCGNYTCFTLRFKAIGSFLPGKAYVSPAFNNSIILDANFMSYYYTVFDATSGSNKIFLYQVDKTNPDDGDGLRAIIGGTVAAVFLIGICYCASKKKRVEKVDENNNNTTQAPLIYSAYNAQPQAVYPGYNGGYQQPQGMTVGYGQN